MMYFPQAYDVNSCLRLLENPSSVILAGFPAAPAQGMKITFEALAKAAQMGPGPAVNSPSGTHGAANGKPPAAKALSVADLERQITGAAASPATTGGFTKDTQASQALMGLLRKGTAAPNPEGADPHATAPPQPQQQAPTSSGPWGMGAGPSAPAPPLSVETSSTSSTRPVGLPTVSSLGSLGGIWGAAPAAAQQQPPPSLSSIWGAPSTTTAAATPASSQPSIASPTVAKIPTAQAAAASLFEHLSNTAAAGTNARPPALAAPPMGQSQPQQAGNPLMALFAKAGMTPQQQQPVHPAASAAPVDDTLNSMLKDLGLGPDPAKPLPPQQQPQQPYASQAQHQAPSGTATSHLQDLFTAARAAAPNPMQQPMQHLHLQQQFMMQQQQMQQQQPRPPGLTPLQAALMQQQMQMQQMQQQAAANFRPPMMNQQQLPTGVPPPPPSALAGAGGFSPAVMQQLQQMQMQQAAMQMMQQRQQQQQQQQFQQKQMQQFMHFQAMQRQQQQQGGAPGGPPGGL